MARIPADKVIELIPDGTFIAITKIGKEYAATRCDNGEDVTDYIRRYTRKVAHDENGGLLCRHTKKGKVQWRKIPMADMPNIASAISKSPSTITKSAPVADNKTYLPDEQTFDGEWVQLSDDDIRNSIEKSLLDKPERLEIRDVRWKYLYRSALRGKNILFVGPSGCGKTMASFCLKDAMPHRPFFYFNMGATQDPRGALIGNTHYSKEKGTFFAKALFAQAIQVPGALILLDEISRAHDDASNILMTVLDENQRYLRIDEDPETPTIKVAPGVTFMATANVGGEYTGTRLMDRALLDRFSVTIEMEPLSSEGEKKVIKGHFPNLSDDDADAIADIANHTREQVKVDDGKVSTIVSTRMSVELAGLINDGFTLAEGAEVCIFPFFSEAGGADSERTYIRQYVQKFLPSDSDDKDSLFEAEQDDDTDNKLPWV